MMVHDDSRPDDRQPEPGPFVDPGEYSAPLRAPLVLEVAVFLFALVCLVVVVAPLELARWVGRKVRRG